jgi:hypothetical protein
METEETATASPDDIPPLEENEVMPPPVIDDVSD